MQLLSVFNQHLDITSGVTVHADPTAAIEVLGVFKWSSEGLICECPNLSGEKGERIPRGMQWCEVL